MRTERNRRLRTWRNVIGKTALWWAEEIMGGEVSSLQYTGDDSGVLYFTKDGERVTIKVEVASVEEITPDIDCPNLDPGEYGLE